MKQTTVIALAILVLVGLIFTVHEGFAGSSIESIKMRPKPRPKHSGGPSGALIHGAIPRLGDLPNFRERDRNQITAAAPLEHPVLLEKTQYGPPPSTLLSDQATCKPGKPKEGSKLRPRSSTELNPVSPLWKMPSWQTNVGCCHCVIRNKRGECTHEICGAC